MGRCVGPGVGRHSRGYKFQRVAQGIDLASADVGSVWALVGLVAGGSLWELKNWSDIVVNINQSVSVSKDGQI